MDNELSTKVIVSNRSQLKAKYGDKIDNVEAAINTLIGADQRRLIQTRLIYMDDATVMGQLGVPLITKAADEKQNKQAIDGVYGKLAPDYLMILGATDIVPHQTMTNPVPGDDDPNVPSDLPYACDAGYSTTIADFIAPTRVTGRLPGVTGSNDPTPLIQAIDASAALETLDREKYTGYFSVSAAVWNGSSTKSLKNIFGNADNLNLSPPSGPKWTDEQLAARSHFVNCHGSDHDPTWYGQSGNNYPHAVEAKKVDGKLVPGVIAAVECCYGAQLYKPSLGGHMSICNTYLKCDACAFCGSSNIAYGPTDGQGEADLITQYFLINLLAGGSAGSAMLSARQRYVLGHNPMDPVDLKTIAQFMLLGDPSGHPVKLPNSEDGKGIPKDRFVVSQRREKRFRFQVNGKAMSESVGKAVHEEGLAPSGEIMDTVNMLAKEAGLVDPVKSSHRIEGNQMFKAVRMCPAGQERFHLACGRRGKADNAGAAFIVDAAVVVVKERCGIIVSTKILYSK